MSVFGPHEVRLVAYTVSHAAEHLPVWNSAQVFSLCLHMAHRPRPSVAVEGRRRTTARSSTCSTMWRISANPSASSLTRTTGVFLFQHTRVHDFLVSTHMRALSCTRASHAHNPLDLILFSRQIKDFSALLRQTFESIILTELYPRSEIDICVQVLQSDGGAKCLRTCRMTYIQWIFWLKLLLTSHHHSFSFPGVNAACINATTLALIDAGIPLLDLACACTAGFLDKVAVVGACSGHCSVFPSHHVI